jgi:hypothetical protein
MDDLPLFKWRPPAELAIFPSTRNLSKIQRTALAAASSKNPENTIRATIDRARTSYVRKGLPPDLIDKEIAELEAALRTQVAFLQSKRGVAK